MVKCINDNLLVRNIPHDPKGRIYIPPEFKKKLRAVQQGEVISAGDGTSVLPMPVKPGNIVVYDRPAGFDIEIDGITYRALKSYQIICAR